MDTPLFLDQYEFHKPIRGSHIWSARDVLTGRLVVIKFWGLKPDGPEFSGEAERLVAKEEFIRRAERMAALWNEHSHLMRVFTAGEVRPEELKASIPDSHEKLPARELYVYTIFDLVLGKSLYEYMRDHSTGQELHKVWAITAQVAKAIDTANQLPVILKTVGSQNPSRRNRGIVHGDVNLSNIIIDGDKCTLIDFAENVAYSNYGYAPVEQRYLKEEEPDSAYRWDIFALGSVMYYMLTGNLNEFLEQGYFRIAPRIAPHEVELFKKDQHKRDTISRVGDNMLEHLKNQMLQKLESEKSKRDVYSKVIKRCFEMSRFHSASEVADALKGVIDTEAKN